jgi:hypothetical protein
MRAFGVRREGNVSAYRRTGVRRRSQEKPPCVRLFLRLDWFSHRGENPIEDDDDDEDDQKINFSHQHSTTPTLHYSPAPALLRALSVTSVASVR